MSGVNRVNRADLPRVPGSSRSRVGLRQRLARTWLLILDDSGLASLSGHARNDLLEILDDRYARRGTNLASHGRPRRGQSLSFSARPRKLAEKGGPGRDCGLPSQRGLTHRAATRPRLRHGPAHEVGQLLVPPESLVQLASHPRTVFRAPLPSSRTRWCIWPSRTTPPSSGSRCRASARRRNGRSSG